ncbi:MAG: rubredoxin [Methylophilaceae bacterium]|nr:rubredoxin [Methylophilaceae bacterium]
METWKCKYCGHLYSEAEGWIRDGIAPGTRMEDIPESWTCPLCKAHKSAFELLPPDLV